ncbi:CHY zinc finger protein [Pullulanibacillus sp. KACC 23026]|uniref:CHY zinc finger protein n=1 Tax=Pullulanibacillus sp. KACC 23026 TaxID=3028315 RepID=UPI0023B04080|nr:CHY zinc finger protein [Pullulanibacillus sp. KACC 23026]WEG10817.1 CHY zinc finger protein [Pullulanibacillus sp. KACC 23026]
MNVKSMNVVGVGVDSETRCSHYHTEKDIIAIKFKCCETYYPCYLCHEACADHPAEQWQVDERHVKAILCGHCGEELTIEAYLNSGSRCPTCQSSFNPNCQLHYHLYFK